MKSINKKAQRIMDRLTDGLDSDYPLRTVDSSGGTYMAVHVELIGTVELGPVYSVAHYYEQNGDMMRDPDVEFIKAKVDGKYYPISFRNDGLGVMQEAVVFEDKKVKGIRIKQQRDIATFCGSWMSNINQQQRLSA